MPIIEGLYGPILKVAKLNVNSDASLLAAAAAGRRFVGFNVCNSVQNVSLAKGNILHGSLTALDSNYRLAGFEVGTNRQETQWFWPGISASDGITVDWVAGTFDIDIFYVDVN